MARDEFFAELFTKPERMEYDHHPPERVLRAYLAGRLGDEWHFDREFLPQLRRADLDGDWGLSEVSLHLLTCNLCCERIARLRAEELAALERERSLGARLLGRVKRWLGLEMLREWNTGSLGGWGISSPWGSRRSSSTSPSARAPSRRSAWDCSTTMPAAGSSSREGR